MVFKLLASSILLACLLWPTPDFAAVTPYPPYPGAELSPAYQVTVDGQPVFVHRFLTYNQFQWMDYASFAMTGKVRVTITHLVSERKVLTCYVRPLAYNIQPQINGNTVTFELDRPRYLIVFLNEEPLFYSTGLMLFAEPPEKNPPRLGDPNVANIQDYKVDNTGKTVETAKINQAISDVSARPGGGVLFFPTGVYMTGTLLMKSNVKLYVDAGALIRGTGRIADYTSAPAPPGAPPGGRQLRAQIIFDNVENAGLMGRGTIDIQGYPKLWFDAVPDTSDGRARSENGLVKDPHGLVARGYVVNNCRNVSFQGLLLLRSAEWTVHVINSENFSTHNIKIVNRKQQHHDDVYDFSGSCKHILIEEGFGMAVDDTFALYGGRDASTGIEDFVVKGFVNYTFTTALCSGYGSVAPLKHVRFENVHFVSNQSKYAIWINFMPRYYAGRAYPEGAKMAKTVLIDDIRFVNCSTENDSGIVYIDGGEAPLTNIVFENCTFHSPTRPSLLMGKNVGPILFKNVKIRGEVMRNADQLRRAGFDLSVPVKFEP